MNNKWRQGSRIFWTPWFLFSLSLIRGWNKQRLASVRFSSKTSLQLDHSLKLSPVTVFVTMRERKPSFPTTILWPLSFSSFCFFFFWFCHLSLFFPSNSSTICFSPSFSNISLFVFTLFFFFLPFSSFFLLPHVFFFLSSLSSQWRFVLIQLMHIPFQLCHLVQLSWSFSFSSLLTFLILLETTYSLCPSSLSNHR